MALAQDQPRHCLVEPGIATAATYDLETWNSRKACSARRTAAQNRRGAPIVAIHANAKVDLARIGIRAELAHEAKDGIGRQALQTLEHLESPAPRAAVEIESTLAAG